MDYITASCVIEQGKIYRNGKLLFASGIPAGADARAEANAPAGADARARANAPARANVPAEANALAGADARARANAPAGANAPAEANALAGANAPAEANAPAKANAPAEANAPVEADAPLTPNTPAFLAPAEFLTAAYRHFDLQYPKFYKMDPLSRLGWIATETLLGPSWDAAIYRPEDIAVVLSNANSSLDTDYKYNETTKDIPSPSVFVYTLPNIVTGEICIRHGFKGENAFFLSPSFDPVLLANYCGYLLHEGIANACITGWVDLLGDTYKAALFLIERTMRPDAPKFSLEAMPPAAPGLLPETNRPDQPEFSAETMQAIFQNPSTS